MSKKAKDLEDKIKNAKAVREKELKEAEGEVTKSKKKMEESGRKMKEKYQVNTSFWSFLSAYRWSFFILNYMDNFVCQSKLKVATTVCLFKLQYPKGFFTGTWKFLDWKVWLYVNIQCAFKLNTS